MAIYIDFDLPKKIKEVFGVFGTFIRVKMDYNENLVSVTRLSSEKDDIYAIATYKHKLFSHTKKGKVPSRESRDIYAVSDI